jgi:serine protease
MRKLQRLSVIALGLSALLSTAHASELRLVVNPEPTVNPQGLPTSPSSTENTTCIMTLDGSAEICVPTPGLLIGNDDPSRTYSPYQSFGVETGQADDAQVIATLNATGWYLTVEMDPEISTGSRNPREQSPTISTSSNASAPNDPDYPEQFYLHPNNQETRITGSGFSEAIEKQTNGNERVGVAVLDTSFWTTSEIEYVSGANFVSIWDNVRGTDNYLFDDTDSLNRQICGGHGTGVSGVVGASINNGKVIAGAVDNVDVYALRVMQCGVGVLSDAADALRWLSGVSIDGIADFDGDVTVANLSLGGGIPTCPTFMQSAIDTANAAGITVVVASGNSGIDVSGFAPGNCQGVMVVGSTTREGDQAGFSNYGNGVDIYTQGVDVLSLGWDDDATYWWEGTSFSAPMVAAGVAIAKRESPSLNTGALKVIMGNTSKPVVSCANGGCSNGILDMSATVDVIQQLGSGELNILQHALGNKTECEQQWYVDHFGDTARLCSLFKATFMGELTAANKHYRLVSRAAGQPSTVDDAIVLETSNASEFLSDIDVETYTYGYQICIDGSCGSTIDFDASSAGVADAPAACQD